VTIKAWVKNEGSFNETFNVTIGVTRIIFQVVATFPNITLPNGEVTIISCTWNTTNWPLGDYTVNAYASPVQGEIATADNSCTDGIVSISIVGDITGMSGVPDGKVNMYDVGSEAKLFGTKYPDPNYNPNFDVNDDGKLNMYDVGLVAMHFGNHT
jgi:hypothetical protein